MRSRGGFVLVGLLLTVANLVALPLPVWAGALADRFGPRPLVVAAKPRWPWASSRSPG